MKVKSVVLKRTFELHREEYEEAALRVLDSGWYILGREMEEFESQLAAWAGVKHCVALNSGTDALILGVRALGIGPGDEVIVPADAYIASVIGITENGATPVFVDADDHLEIDVDQIEDRVTENTKAILPVHLYGQCSRMDKVVQIAKKYGLRIIEDCAQCLGSMYNGQMAGTFGDIGCLSFYPTKPLGAFGDAGAILTNDDETAEKIRLLRNYGSKIKYHNEINGVNSRMDEVQAAVLKVGLKYLNDGNKERRRQAKFYRAGISNNKITIPDEYDDVYHVYHLFPVLAEDRDAFQSFLKINGVETQVHYPIPPYIAECNKNWGYQWSDFPVSEKIANHEVSLPIYCGLSNEEIQYVVDVINRY